MVIRYFAYGSNMLPERLKERVPSAQVSGHASLPEYVLRFNKLSKDGSVKANIQYTANPSDSVHGVVYELDDGERRLLDRAEGLGKGYEVIEVPVWTSAGEQEAFTYVADPGAIRDDLKPYSCYKDMIITGAMQNRLPPAYVHKLEAIEVADDPRRE